MSMGSHSPNPRFEKFNKNDFYTFGFNFYTLTNHVEIDMFKRADNVGTG